MIVPSFTFTSSALAFARQGARILFCDIEPETLGPRPRHLAELLDDSVRAVVVVHYAGIACDVAGVREVLADRPDVGVVEDNAHGLFGRWRGEPLGSLGRFATLSFHETKNFVCGEGGALLLNDPRDVDRARVLYDKGTDRQAFLLGQVDKYSWRDTGSSFGLSDTLAAYLLGPARAGASRSRPSGAGSSRRYLDALAPPAAELGLRLPGRPGRLRPGLPPLLRAAARPRDRDPVMARAARARASRRRSTTCRCTAPRAAGGSPRATTECPVTTDVSAPAAPAAVLQHAHRGRRRAGRRRRWSGASRPRR